METYVEKEELNKYMRLMETAIQDGPKHADWLEWTVECMAKGKHKEEAKKARMQTAARYNQFNKTERDWIVNFDMTPIWWAEFMKWKPKALKEVISGVYTGRGY